MSEYSDFHTTISSFSRIDSCISDHRREVSPGFANYFGLLCNKSCQTIEQPSLTLQQPWKVLMLFGTGIFSRLGTFQQQQLITVPES